MLETKAGNIKPGQTAFIVYLYSQHARAGWPLPQDAVHLFGYGLSDEVCDTLLLVAAGVAEFGGSLQNTAPSTPRTPSVFSYQFRHGPRFFRRRSLSPLGFPICGVDFISFRSQILNTAHENDSEASFQFQGIRQNDRCFHFSIISIDRLLYRRKFQTLRARVNRVALFKQARAKITLSTLASFHRNDQFTIWFFHSEQDA
jgi:hypothetical protein